MTPIKRNLNYQFKDGRLRLRIRWDGRQIFLHTGHKIDRTKWEGSRCKPNSTHGDTKVPASVINRSLDSLEAAVDEVFSEFELRDAVPGPEDIRKAVTSGSTRSLTVRSAFLDFIEHGRTTKMWSPATVKSVVNVQMILERFDSKLTFPRISYDTLNRLVTHMGSHRVSPNEFHTGQKGYSNATILKHCRTLRWFLSWATQKGYLKEAVWKDWQPVVKTIKQPVVFLEWEELMKLEAADLFPGSEEERAKDFFLFCCFSGLRYSDAAALRKSAVHDDYFEVITQKTGTPLRIELNDHSRRIMEKYRDSKDDHALPRITNNRLNHLIKVIGETLDIGGSVLSQQYYGGNRIERNEPKWARLSSHCARRTFICNALALQIPLHVVMKWTGHTEYSSMRPYIEATEKIKAEAMKRFNLSHDSTPQGAPEAVPSASGSHLQPVSPASGSNSKSVPGASGSQKSLGEPPEGSQNGSGEPRGAKKEPKREPKTRKSTKKGAK